MLKVFRNADSAAMAAKIKSIWKFSLIDFIFVSLSPPVTGLFLFRITFMAEFPLKGY